MSDPVDRAVDAQIDAYRPDAVPPFSAIEARKRSRDRRRGASAVAACGLAVAAVAFVPSSLLGGGDRSGQVAQGSPAPDVTATADRCFGQQQGAERTHQFDGLSEDEALVQAPGEPEDRRVVARDGECLGVRADLKQGRANLIVEDGQVVWAAVERMPGSPNACEAAISHRAHTDGEDAGYGTPDEAAAAYSRWQQAFDVAIAVPPDGYTVTSGPAGDAAVLRAGDVELDASKDSRGWRVVRVRACAAAPVDVAGGLAVGETATHSMLTHCGVESLRINGRWWNATAPLYGAGGPGTGPPDGWGDPFQPGTLTLQTENRAVFEALGQQVVLKPSPTDEPIRICR